MNTDKPNTVHEMCSGPNGATLVTFNVTEKGKPARTYEPFFSALARRPHAFEFGVAVGVGDILIYDPLVRLVAKLHPDHSWEKVLFDPWRQESWDRNDTALIANPRADADMGGVRR